MSDSVRLTIKNPSSRDDFSLEISLHGTTVKEIKQRLSQEYPSQPPVTQQKLIFYGRLLQDSDPLSQVFASVGFFPFPLES